jgi:hypothetical protein
MNLYFNHVSIAQLVIFFLCETDHYNDLPAASSPTSCMEEGLRGLTTSKPVFVDSTGRVLNAERTLRLIADTALFTLRREPFHAILDTARAGERASTVTSGVPVGLVLAT